MEVAWAEGLPAALRNAALNMRAGMKDLAGEPSSLYSQVAKYRFKNPGEGGSAGVSIKVDSNTVSAGTLSSNVKNLEKASAAVESKDSEGQTSTPQDPSDTTTTESVGKQDDSGDAHSEAQDGSDVPTGEQVEHAEDSTKISVVESTTPSETTGDTTGSSGTPEDVAGSSDPSKDTSQSPSQTSKTFQGDTSRLSGAIGGVVAFFESVRNVRDNSGDTTEPASSDVTVTPSSETGTKDQTKSVTSDDEKSSEVVTSQDDKHSEKQSGMIYTMTR